MVLPVVPCLYNTDGLYCGIAIHPYGSEKQHIPRLRAEMGVTFVNAPHTSITILPASAIFSFRSVFKTLLPALLMNECMDK
jgi:hypothetical protein